MKPSLYMVMSVFVATLFLNIVNANAGSGPDVSPEINYSNHGPNIFPLPQGSTRLTCGLRYGASGFYPLNPSGVIFNQHELETSLQRAMGAIYRNAHVISTSVSDRNHNVTIKFHATIAPICSQEDVPMQGCRSVASGRPSYKYQVTITDNSTGVSATTESFVSGTYRISEIQNVTLNLNHSVQIAEAGNAAVSSVGTYCQLSDL